MTEVTPLPKPVRTKCPKARPRRRGMKRDANDKRWSLAVRTRDGFTCQWPTCGRKHAQNSTGLHAAHIFSRSIKRTRCDVENGIALCYPHHTRFDHLSKEEREAFIRRFMGDIRYEALRERANSPLKRQAVQA